MHLSPTTKLGYLSFNVINNIRMCAGCGNNGREEAFLYPGKLLSDSTMCNI